MTYLDARLLVNVPTATYCWPEQTIFPVKPFSLLAVRWREVWRKVKKKKKKIDKSTSNPPQKRKTTQMNYVQDQKWIKALSGLMGLGILVHFWVLFLQNLHLSHCISSRKQRLPFYANQPVRATSLHAQTHTQARTHLWQSYCSSEMNSNQQQRRHPTSILRHSNH